MTRCGIQGANGVEEAFANLIDDALNRPVPHDARQAVVDTFLDAVDTDPLTLRDNGVGRFEKPEEQTPLATFQAFGQNCMPKTVFPLPDDPNSIVIEPLRTPPRSIESSSGIPNPSF